MFDLTKGGPGPAIQMFRNVPDVRLLACGGDGTAGWVLSVLDKADLDHPPPVGVLPLGTGNDLSRSIGWGGGYEDEPLRYLDHLKAIFEKHGPKSRVMHFK